jgi:hypothetical protein
MFKLGLNSKGDKILPFVNSAANTLHYIGWQPFTVLFALLACLPLCLNNITAS